MLFKPKRSIYQNISAIYRSSKYNSLCTEAKNGENTGTEVTTGDYDGKQHGAKNIYYNSFMDDEMLDNRIFPSIENATAQ